MHILHSIPNLVPVNDGSLVKERYTSSCVHWLSIYPVSLMFAQGCTKGCSLQNCFCKVASLILRGGLTLLVLPCAFDSPARYWKCFVLSQSCTLKQLQSKANPMTMGSMLTYIWTGSQSLHLSLVSFSQEVIAACVLSLSDMESLHTAVKLYRLHAWAMRVHVSWNPCMTSCLLKRNACCGTIRHAGRLTQLWSQWMLVWMLDQVLSAPSFSKCE